MSKKVGVIGWNGADVIQKALAGANPTIEELKTGERDEVVSYHHEFSSRYAQKKFTKYYDQGRMDMAKKVLTEDMIYMKIRKLPEVTHISGEISEEMAPMMEKMIKTAFKVK